MIMIYDEGAWHPADGLILLWFIMAIAGFVPLIRLARGRRGRWLVLGGLLPLFGLAAFMIYFDWGRSAEYTGDGTLGAGARLDIIAALGHTLGSYAPYLVSTLAVLGLAHWTWLRRRARLLFWPLFSLGLVFQLLSDVAIVIGLMEPGY
jgi:hypothetical protein